MRKFLFYSVFLLALLWGTQTVAAGVAASPEDCLECHDVSTVENFTA